MQIVIYRTNKNRLYTEGELVINDDHQTFTVEATDCMLPAGKYLLRIVKKSERKQSLSIFSQEGKNTGWRIGIGSSFITSRKERIIAIGSRLIPGAVYKATSDYERLVDRISKCSNRKEEVELVISESFCKKDQPINHWLTLVVMALLLCSCSGLRKTVVVTHATHDTAYVNKIVYDSVYIDRWHNIDRLNDTVFVHDIEYQYKYRLLRDTIRDVRIDSVPVVREVEVVKTERYIPAIYKWSLGICIVLLILLIIYVVWKIKF